MGDDLGGAIRTAYFGGWTGQSWCLRKEEKGTAVA